MCIRDRARLKDRGGRDLVLAMTHEEVVADLVRREVRSYRPVSYTHLTLPTSDLV